MQLSILFAILNIAATLNSPSIKNDTIKSEQTFLEQKLNRDYDSLLLSFYVQNAFEDTTTTVGDTLFVNDLAIDTTLHSYDINDSLIIKQMSEMQVLFDMSFNPIVKTFIEVYSQRKRALTETVLGLSEYYFP